MSDQTEVERATEYLASFGITATSIATVTEWQFLNADGSWIDGNRNFPEVSARDNAKYYKTNRVRSREVTYTEWEES
jgi:hypothetical protein